MKNKFILCIILLFITVILLNQSVVADEDDTTVVYVTICVNGLRTERMPIVVKDTDSDGSLTINDALVLAHDAKYEGGSKSGYISREDSWGLCIVRLWGVENGGSYGYYINNKSALNLTDAVTANDEVYAYAYSDLISFSDVFTFFDKQQITCTASECQITLTLNGVSFNENWETVLTPIENARLVIDGTPVDVFTDSDGKAEVNVSKVGKHTVTAVSSTTLIVPPIATIDVVDDVPKTSDGGICMAVMVLLLCLGVLLVSKRK